MSWVTLPLFVIQNIPKNSIKGGGMRMAKVMVSPNPNAIQFDATRQVLAGP
jgi:hypothetical protein